MTQVQKAKGSRGSKIAYIVAGVLIGCLITTFFFTVLRSSTPQYHENLVKATTIYVQWPYGTTTQDLYLMPRLLAARTGVVGTVFSLVDLYTIVTRSFFYNVTLPESIWEWTLNGTAAAVMRIIGPFLMNNVNVWLVEITRLTMSQLTIYLPDGSSEIMEPAMGLTTPLVGYTIHFYKLEGSIFKDAGW